MELDEASKAKRIHHQWKPDVLFIENEKYLKDIEELGFDIVIWPVTSLRCEAAAMKQLFNHLREYGGQGDYLDNLMERKEIYSVIEYHKYEDLDQSISRSIVPD